MKKVKNKKKKYVLLSLVSAAIVLILLGAAAMALASEAASDRIIRNVYVDGIRIGGMKTAEASAVLEEEFSSRKVTLRAEGSEKSFTLEELGLRYKTDALVGEAYDLGKRGGFIKNVADICRSFVLPKRYSSAGALVSTEPSAELLEYLAGFTVLPTESVYEIGEDKVTVTNGMNGREADANLLLVAVSGIKDFSEPLEVPMNVLPFELPDVENIRMKAASRPRAPYGRDAEGHVTATVKSFDPDDARAVQRGKLNEGDTYEFQMNTEETVVLSDEDLYPDTVGTCSTEFDTGYATRASNIKLAAGFLNGAELLPGETFSYNGRCGDITAERGYQVAKGYANGTVVDTVGAGVCQVSSTLYNAALLSNMDIVTRSSHSLPVAYLPLGQDAAISYPNQDFSFKNSSAAPVKIFASVSGGKITVEIRGQKDGSFDEIKIENNTLSVIQPATKEVVDETLAPGGRVVSQRGSKGYVVESFRLVYKGGELKEREPLGKSTYKAQDTIINVGRAENEQDSQL